MDEDNVIDMPTAPPTLKELVAITREAFNQLDEVMKCIMANTPDGAVPVVSEPLRNANARFIEGVNWIYNATAQIENFNRNSQQPQPGGAE